MAIIGVDVDLTIVDSDVKWFEWCQSHSNVCRREIFYNTKELLPYAYTKIFNDLDGKLVLDFWRGETVYDEMTPREGCVKALKELADQGHEIVFVSTIKGNHHKSKFNFVKRHFPFMSGFLATKEKEYVRLDFMVDDRISILKKCSQRGIIPILANTRYDQDWYEAESYRINVVNFDHWNDFLPMFYEADRLRNEQNGR